MAVTGVSGSGALAAITQMFAQLKAQAQAATAARQPQPVTPSASPQTHPALGRLLDVKL